MGQAVRMISYHYNGDTSEPVSVLNLEYETSTLESDSTKDATPESTSNLVWKTLDDGVMGGQSHTNLSSIPGKTLQFAGVINTAGGGFASARASISDRAVTYNNNMDDDSCKQTDASTSVNSIRIRYKGDGKTYKLIMSAGKAGGPFARNPSWQADIATKRLIVHKNISGAQAEHTDGAKLDSHLDNAQHTISGHKGDDCDHVRYTDTSKDSWEEQIIKFSQLLPTWGGKPSSRPPAEEKAKYTFDITEMTEIGVMLSLKLSDGSSNPPETFGEGVFPFALHVKSITLLNS